MSSISPNLGFTLADPTDVFNNDTYIKGNFNIIDTNVLKKNQVVQGAGQKMEVVIMSVTCSGSVHTVSATSPAFANTYTAAPTVVPAYVVQSVSYADTMAFPFVNSISLTGFSCEFNTINSVNNFGAGTLKMAFLVFGS